MGDIELKFTFTEEDIKYIKTKFDIEDKEDLYNAVWEMISTYMEL